MRTTLDLDDDLMKAVKRLAADTGRTMTAIVEESLRTALAVRPGAKRRVRWTWVTVKGTGRPGVDVTDRDRLYDAMEGRE
ncbi:MAG: ribbon-helix-helix domain-containing protein [Acidobacteriota bacterium]